MKKKSLLLLTLVFLMMTCLSFTAQAASPKLNKKSATILVGKTVQLTLENYKKKVVWTSNKRSVATVTKKGVVKGVKPGSCKITATVGKKNYVCKVTVKKPINVKKYMKTVTLTEANIKDYLEVVYDNDTHGATLATATGSTYIKDKQVKDGWYPLDDGTQFSFKLSTSYWNGKSQVYSNDVEYNSEKMKCTRTLFHDKTISNFEYSFSDVQGTIKYVNKKAIIDLVAGVAHASGWTHARAALADGKTKSLSIFYLDGRYF